MKGIAIAIETIIYLILAVTVLAVLLVFFTSMGGQSQNQVENEFTRNTRCAQYAKYDLKCESMDKFPTNLKEGGGPLIDALRKDIAKACKALGDANCNMDLATIECIRSCCIQCPK